MSTNKHNTSGFTDEELMEDLRTWLPRGSSIYLRTEYRVPGPNGTGVNIVPLVMEPKSPGPRNISWHLLNLGIGRRPTNKHSWGSVRVNGVGLDLEKKLAMDISTRLYGDPHEILDWTF